MSRAYLDRTPGWRIVWESPEEWAKSEWELADGTKYPEFAHARVMGANTSVTESAKTVTVRRSTLETGVGRNKKGDLFRWKRWKKNEVLGIKMQPNGRLVPFSLGWKGRKAGSMLNSSIDFKMTWSPEAASIFWQTVQAKWGITDITDIYPGMRLLGLTEPQDALRGKALAAMRNADTLEQLVINLVGARRSDAVKDAVMEAILVRQQDSYIASRTDLEPRVGRLRWIAEMSPLLTDEQLREVVRNIAGSRWSDDNLDSVIPRIDGTIGFPNLRKHMKRLPADKLVKAASRPIRGGNKFTLDVSRNPGFLITLMGTYSGNVNWMESLVNATSRTDEWEAFLASQDRIELEKVQRCILLFQEESRQGRAQAPSTVDELLDLLLDTPLEWVLQYLRAQRHPLGAQAPPADLERLLYVSA